MAQANNHSPDYSTTEIDSETDFESPVKKKLFLASREDGSSSTSCIKNGNQSVNKSSENSKHANSAGELSCNNTSSDECGETVPFNDINVLSKIKVSPTTSIEIASVKFDTSHGTMGSADKEQLDLKIENKLIQNVYRQELKCARQLSPPTVLEWKDSGMSSCQESSQEFSSSPIEEGTLARSLSNASTRSLESQSECLLSQASTQVQQDSDDETDSEGILTRVDEFTKERNDKMKQSSDLTPMPSGFSDDFSADINDSNLGMCRFCMVNPKNGVFVHNNCLHLCCCYKCAIKVWKKRKSCPICNCKIKNVTKLFVH